MDEKLTLKQPWDPRMLLDLAIAVDPLEVILDRYQTTQEAYDRLCGSPVFRQQLASTMKAIREDGSSFRTKAKVQAESYLPILDDMVWDLDVAPSTRLDAIKSIVRWGDLEPKEKKEREEVKQPQINVQINF